MSVDLTALAAVALNDEGRRTVEQLRTDLSEVGWQRWAEQNPELADDLGDEQPPDARLLVGVGVGQETIGWVDWSGEDDEHQVRDMVLQASSKLGLSAPTIPADLEDHLIDELADSARRGEYVPALLQAVDAHLSAAGLRLLLIDQDSDTYYFIPVTADSFDALNGQAGNGFQLFAATTP